MTHQSKSNSEIESAGVYEGAILSDCNQKSERKSDGKIYECCLSDEGKNRLDRVRDVSLLLNNLLNAQSDDFNGGSATAKEIGSLFSYLSDDLRFIEKEAFYPGGIFKSDTIKDALDHIRGSN